MAPDDGTAPSIRRPLRAEEDIRASSAPTLIVLGDSDGIRLEHAVELFRLRGGGVMGDLAGVPASHLAVLPGTFHFVPPGPASSIALRGSSR